MATRYWPCEPLRAVRGSLTRPVLGLAPSGSTFGGSNSFRTSCTSSTSMSPRFRRANTHVAPSEGANLYPPPSPSFRSLMRGLVLGLASFPPTVKFLPSAVRLEPKPAPHNGGAPQGCGVPGGNPAGRRIESRRDRMSRREDPQNNAVLREPRSGAEDRGAGFGPAAHAPESSGQPIHCDLPKGGARLRQSPTSFTSPFGTPGAAGNAPHDR